MAVTYPSKHGVAVTARVSQHRNLAIVSNPYYIVKLCRSLQAVLQQVAQTARRAAAGGFAEAANFASNQRASGLPTSRVATEFLPTQANTLSAIASSLAAAQQQRQPRPPPLPKLPDPIRVGRAFVRERRMHDASRTYLDALVRAPADPRLQRNLELTMNEFRRLSPQPWVRWPWEYHRVEVATEETERAPPGQMDAPRQVRPPLEMLGGWGSGST